MKVLVIEKANVKLNLAAIRQKAGSAEIIADLSGGGQGMGLVGAAMLLREEGVRCFAVNETGDAVQLRKNGFTEEQILMLRSVADTYELKTLLENSVIFTVGSYDAGIALNGLAEGSGSVAEVRVRIDTGLGQYGFLPSETDKVLKLFRHMSSLAISGVYTRLSSAGSKEFIEKQYRDFTSVIDTLQAEGIETGTVHALDSSALFNCDFGEQAAVCVGSALIGRTSAPAGSGLVKTGYIEAALEEVDWLPKGTVVGMTDTVKLKKPTKAAVLDVGWYNGVALSRYASEPFFRRIRSMLSGKSRYEPLIKVNGKKVQVLGQVGYTGMAVNVTKCDCNSGDLAHIEADPRMVRGLMVDFR